jgi:adenylate cyclase
MNHKKALEEAATAISLGPNDPMNYFALAFAKYYYGNFQEAISLCEKAERLTPYRPTIFFNVIGWSYRMLGKYEEALSVFNELFERAQKGEYNILLAHNYLAATYAMQGNMSKARFHATELLKVNPNYSLELDQQSAFYRKPEHLKLVLDALRKAGIPDTPQNKESL